MIEARVYREQEKTMFFRDWDQKQHRDIKRDTREHLQNPNSSNSWRGYRWVKEAEIKDYF